MKKFLSSFLLFALITLSVLSGGCETEKERNAREVKELRKGAVSGSSMAQISLAGVYASGSKGIDINPSASVFWLRRVAQKGQADAQYSVGMAFYTGEGVSKNEEEGFYWINQAAKQEHYGAENFLRRTPHGKITETPSNPKIWGYVFSSALFGDLYDAYSWLFIIGVLAALGTGPIGIMAFIIFILHFIS